VSLRVSSLRSRPSSSNLPGYKFQIPSLSKFFVPESLSTNRVAVNSKGAADTLPGFAIAYMWAPPNLVLSTLRLVVTALLTPPPNLAPLPSSPPVETSPEENIFEVQPAALRTTTPLGPQVLTYGDRRRQSALRSQTTASSKNALGLPCRVGF
jgi:hypothetical protein